MSAAPFSIFVFTSKESNSVQSWQSASRLSRCRLCIFHFPTRKSKSLGDELGEAVILRSPLASISTLGIGIFGSGTSSGFCPYALKIAGKKSIKTRRFMEIAMQQHLELRQMLVKSTPTSIKRVFRQRPVSFADIAETFSTASRYSAFPANCGGAMRMQKAEP